MSTIEQATSRIGQEADLTNQLELVALLFSSDGRLWLEHNGDGVFDLPRIQIPKYSRVAQEAVKAAQGTLNVSIFCLWEMMDEAGHYLVAHLLDTTKLPSSFCGIVAEQFSQVIPSEEMLRVVTTAYNQTFSVEELEAVRAPFNRIAWLSELEQALQPVLKEKGIRLAGAVEQFNASSTFALLKLETTDAPLWFKAVGEPNLAEYSITSLVSNLFPGTMPSIVATFPKWHGWVMEDSRGQRLDATADIGNWKRAAMRIADIQVESLSHLDELFRAGCTDCRTSSLRAHLDVFVEAMVTAMAADQHLKISRFDRSHVEQVAAGIASALGKLDHFEVPDALIHRDLSGGNIQRLPDRDYFLDWAQACVGPPFICSEYINIQYSRMRGWLPEGDPELVEMTNAYMSRWSQVLSPDQFEVSAACAPILAEYLYVLPMDGRSPLDLTDTRDGRAVLRSMLRRMSRSPFSHPHGAPPNPEKLYD